MTISRRTLIGTGLVGLLGAPVASWTAALAAPSTTSLVRSRFAPHLRQVFRMVTPTQSLSVTLVAITDLNPVLVPNDETRFSLLFHLGSGNGPGQGTYSFRRGGFATTSLFVVAIGAAPGDYEAIINTRR